MQIIYDKEFLKSYKKLSNKLKDKVDGVLAIFIENEFDPRLHNHKLHGEYKNYSSIDVTGDVRIIYKKIDSVIRILLDVGTHSQLYK